MQFSRGGATKPINSVPFFPNFSTSPKYMLAIEYHAHILQVLSLLSSNMNVIQII